MVTYIQKVQCIPALLTVVLITLISCQIPRDKLSNIGVIVDEGKSLKIAGSYESRYIILSLVPGVDLENGCGTAQVIQYKSLLNRLLIPLRDALDLQEALITVTNDTTTNVGVPQSRFFGAVVGTIALGVATSAQITAGIALAEAREAKRDIALIKESMTKTHKSIELLQNAVGEQILALKTLQDFVNDEIRPAISELGCETAALRLGIKLTQHYSELLTAFGSNLGTIGEKSLTLQALSSLYSANITEIMTTIKTGQSNIYDVIYTEQIKGTVIDVDLERYMVTLSVKIPILSEVPGVLIHKASSISYNIDGEEWYVTVPSHILSRASFLGGANIADCVESRLTYICPRDPAQLIPDSQQKCILGDTTRCPVTKVVDSLIPKFAFMNGGIVANCIASSCTCGTGRKPISQDRSTGVVFLTHENCGLIGVNGIELYANRKGHDTTWGVQNLTVGPAIAIRPVDISLNLAAATDFLQDSRAELEKARKILSEVGRWYNSGVTLITIIVVMIIVSIIIIVIVITLCRLKKSMLMNNPTGRISKDTYTLEPKIRHMYANGGFDAMAEKR
ncbi:fusion protein [Respirovirus P045T/pangolin/2018]|nr:fusion protein [Respirovirus P021T/pangolin/2018]URG17227.1 fusion protein [Respirovirus P030T/pangolin/2018]URG17233.1 fusion protein [Respirovirus P040T/pangolin/2018]URG17239.1 fusion protein [Respirovirus P045T/pangolin/2018]